MKKRGILFLVVGVVLLAGCSAASGTAVKESTGAAGTGSGDTDRADMEKSVDWGGVNEPMDSQYTWEEITITLPEGWEGRCVMVEHENGFSVCQKASYEKDESLGFICGFCRAGEPLDDIGAETMVAYTDDGMLYYLIQPMDVPCDTENEEISAEYMRMCSQVPQAKDSIQIAASGIHYDAEEYVLPTSSFLALDKDMLGNLSDNDLWVARNEIYARHGRQFKNGYLQRHFNQCTWYEGTVPAEDFKESTLSQTEKDNIKALAAAEQEYDVRHPYPKRYQTSETAREDLTGDGTADEISYEVTEQEDGEYQCQITVNGEAFIASELTYWESETPMTNPMIDGFYITDIFERDDTLEIAVVDEGPSEDMITYFFLYDGTLSCIGEVPGVPFADMNEGYNGFDEAGVIAGRQQMDLIETAYLRGYWYYLRRRIICQDSGWYDFESAGEHALYEDLPVHNERDEASGTTIIPAQERVFFLGSDRKQWILVKGKDGRKGYMLVQDGKIAELGKPADEVFSDLYFFD